MSKPVFAMVLGGVLGVFDGLTALVSGGPEIPSQIGTIVAGSTFTGVVAGLIVGLVARKTQSTAMVVGSSPPTATSQTSPPREILSTGA